MSAEDIRTPESGIEEQLARLAGEEIEPREPVSAIEQWLELIYESGGGGGGGGLTPEQVQAMIDTSLVGYETTADLATTLADYVTATSLATTLTNYETTAALATTLANYYTSAQTDAAIAAAIAASITAVENGSY